MSRKTRKHPQTGTSCNLPILRRAQAARHPLLVIGAGANRKMTSNMLRRFVDAVGMPFCDTQQGKGVIDSREPRAPASFSCPCQLLQTRLLIQLVSESGLLLTAQGALRVLCCMSLGGQKLAL